MASRNQRCAVPESVRDQTAAGQAYMFANTVNGVIQDIDGTLWSINGVGSTSFGKPDGRPDGSSRSPRNTGRKTTRSRPIPPRPARRRPPAWRAAAPLREGDRNVWAVALEMNFPVLKTLDTRLLDPLRRLQ